MSDGVALNPGAAPRNQLARRLDWLALALVVAVAAVARLPGILTRGRFDADQGTDMLVLLGMTRDGVLPLLGAKTSVGDFHQAAFYYYALWPAAAVSDADPAAVTIWIALLGIAAVALAWWLGRAIAGCGGSTAGGLIGGLAAGLLVAVSPAAIEGSTFIWNPNLIPLCALLAVSAAWHAHVSRRPTWWLVAIAAAGAVPGLHVIGAAFLVGIGVLWLLEIRRSPGHERRGLLLAGAGGALAIGVMFLPLLAYELQTGFVETRLVVEYLTGDSLRGGLDIVARLPFTLLRVIATPVVGLVTDVPSLAAIVTALVIVLTGWRLVASRGLERTGLAWLVALVAWGIVVLLVAAPSLQHVVPGLPTDHYHAFIDPLLAVAIGVSVAGVAVPGGGATRSSPVFVRARRVGAAVLVGGLVVASVTRWPPQADPNGGWPAMRDAGERVDARAGHAPILLLGLPAFKKADAIRFPIERVGGTVADDPTPLLDVEIIVVVCDRLFEPVIGTPCGGPAEDALVQSRFGATGVVRGLVDRFDASPRTAISIYATQAAP